MIIAKANFPAPIVQPEPTIDICGLSLTDVQRLRDLCWQSSCPNVADVMLHNGCSWKPT